MQSKVAGSGMGYAPLSKAEFVVSMADDDAEHEFYIIREPDVRDRVVRCKDCIGLVETWDGWECERFSGEYHRAEPDGFCKWGERRGA